MSLTCVCLGPFMTAAESKTAFSACYMLAIRPCCSAPSCLGFFSAALTPRLSPCANTHSLAKTARMTCSLAGHDCCETSVTRRLVGGMSWSALHVDFDKSCQKPCRLLSGFCTCIHSVVSSVKTTLTYKCKCPV